MKTFIAFALMLISSIVPAVNNPEISEIRKDLYASVESSLKTETLLNKLQSLQQKDADITGYIGTLQALRAKHAWNPYYKVSYLDQASKTLDKAVKLDPKNIEIRFLRYTVEYFVPPFLGYSKHVAEDRKVLIQEISNRNFKPEDIEVIRNVVNFLIEKAECSEVEITKLKQAII